MSTVIKSPKAIALQLARKGVEKIGELWVDKRSNTWAVYLKREELKAYHASWIRRQKKAGEPFDLQAWREHFLAKQKEYEYELEPNSSGGA
jgi:hypothetical protein